MYDNQTDMLERSTYYILDAQGQQLSMYEHVVDATEVHYHLAERNLYGSSRLGTVKDPVDLYAPDLLPSYGVFGNRNYELSNHLGNVLAVITDQVISLDENTDDEVDGYSVSLATVADYSPFGVQLDGRTDENTGYRYGFNGMEKDNEVKGEGNSYTTHFRQFDLRLGRWLSLDPRMAKYPQISPYVAYANNPILFVDDDGDTIRLHGTDAEQWKALAFLQVLTNDKLILKNGIVYIDMMNARNCEKELPVGTDLIRDLVSHKFTTHIVLNTMNVNQADRMPGNPSENEINGVGTDQRVDSDLTHLNKYLTQDPKTGKNSWTHDAREFTFAHELIHAYYGMEGRQERWGDTQWYDYVDETGKIEKDYANKEELKTVGLTGDRKYTENKIRNEHKGRTRAKY